MDSAPGSTLLDPLEFTVYGAARPAGALAIGRAKDGRQFLRHRGGNALSEWKNAIRDAAGALVTDLEREAVAVRATFYVARPAGHYGKNGLRGSAPAYPIKRSAGDVDKLARALLDALTGVVFADDSQVVDLDVSKRYADTGPVRLDVRVSALGDELDVRLGAAAA